MTVLGLMSGTSLDGLDLALCTFNALSPGYSFEILKAKTIAYSPEWKELLAGVKSATAEDYFALHARYGKYVAEEVNSFINGQAQPQLIASHGHTVFHQPQRGFSTQIGCGATIAAVTGITTVCDFRSLDVANGGQGAPLVPVGDAFLFGMYQACLNIGGIANISFYDASGKRLAYDICEANMLLNHLAEKTGALFDRGGALARSGNIQAALLSELNSLSYYSQTGARSMGREWFEKNILQRVENTSFVVSDLLATATEHIAQIIANDLNTHAIKNVLVTGGGAFNDLLIERIKEKTSSEVILPSAEIINFKEALIFAFLGYLRASESINTLSSVTGAGSNSIGGAVYAGATLQS